MLLEELLFSLGVLAAQDGVPGREPPKSLDLRHMPLRRSEAHIDPLVLFFGLASRLQSLPQAARCDYRNQALLLHQRHVERRRLDDGNLLIEVSSDSSCRDVAGLRIGAEGVSGIAEKVA